MKVKDILEKLSFEDEVVVNYYYTGETKMHTTKVWFDGGHPHATDTWYVADEWNNPEPEKDHVLDFYVTCIAPAGKYTLELYATEGEHDDAD